MNIPNLLSLFRLALVPVLAVVFFQPTPNARYWAAGIYALAFITDIADGYIARKYNQITRLGRILDPLADKMMTFTVIICITAANIIPIWAVLIFVLKEAALGIGALTMYNKIGDVIPSRSLGKLSTGVFFLVCAALVLFPSIPMYWATWMIAIALTIAVAAFLQYLTLYLRQPKKTKE